MGSYGDTVNLLQYLRSQSNVDCDSLDLQCKYPFSTEIFPHTLIIWDSSSGQGVRSVRGLHVESSMSDPFEGERQN